MAEQKKRLLDITATLTQITHFRVGIIRRLETDLLNPHLVEKDAHETYEVRQGQVTICNNSFDLMELCKMGSIHSLVSEDSVDTE